MKFHILWVICVAALVGGCDKMEGSARDASRSIGEGLAKVKRDVLVSDLQKNAEALCIQAVNTQVIKYSVAQLPPERMHVVNYMGQNIQDVSVIGYGKYDIRIKLTPDNRPTRPYVGILSSGDVPIYYDGICSVEDGRVVDLRAL